MTKKEILDILTKEIHSTVFATIDHDGLPQTCVIDIMMADDDGLYFLTAKGKSFYERLMDKPFVAISGMKGADTLSTIAISIRGNVRNIGKKYLREIFDTNPYMNKIYPTKSSQDALEVFQLYKGEGEYFDLSQLPPFRQGFSFGGEVVHETGYKIEPQKCIGCDICIGVCPVHCIDEDIPRKIDSHKCLHCGNCYRECPANAVIKLT